MDDKDLEKLFGITAEQIKEWSDAIDLGEFPGTPKGKILVGRPRLFGDELKPVTFKEPLTKITAIDARAASLEMSRSDYLRYLVDNDLAVSSG